jgi:transposase
MTTPTSAPEQLFESPAPEADIKVVVKAPVNKTFRPYDHDQQFLLPPSIKDWLPEGHLARFVDELVDEVLDLDPFLNSYTDVRGYSPYDPRLMIKLVLYGYLSGVRSSRKIEKACHDSVAFRFLAANAAPDFCSIARFRRRHLEALRGLFLESLTLCQAAGMVRLGRVALDGTKRRANASRHKAMSYRRMGEIEQRLQCEVDELLADAEATDQREDQALGVNNRGDDLEGELARRETRLAKIRAAKADLEDDARRRAGEAARQAATKKIQKTKGSEPTSDEQMVEPTSDGQLVEELVVQMVEPTSDEQMVEPTSDGQLVEELVEEMVRQAEEKATPKDSAQRNFTDPDSRVMKTSDGSFHYCYNAQAVVDDAHQVIIATRLDNRGADSPAFSDMLDLVMRNCGASPVQVLADAGYFSEDNVKAAESRGIDPLIATGRLRHSETPPKVPRGPVPKDATPKERMARKLRTTAGRAAYARRKAIVEPVFGQMDVVQNAKHLLLRGENAAAAEWELLSACHNLRKLFGVKGTAKFAST